jgi:hypothetical protein
MLIVIADPHFECTDYSEGTGPFLQPEAFLFQRAHHPLGVRIGLGIIIACKGLLDPKGSTGSHEARRGRLTAVGTHQRQPLAPGAPRELAIDGHIQGREPMLRRAAYAGIVPDDCLGVPVEHNHDVDPVKALDYKSFQNLA